MTNWQVKMNNWTSASFSIGGGMYPKRILWTLNKLWMCSWLSLVRCKSRQNAQLDGWKFDLKICNLHPPLWYPFDWLLWLPPPNLWWLLGPVFSLPLKSTTVAPSTLVSAVAVISKTCGHLGQFWIYHLENTFHVKEGGTKNIYIHQKVLYRHLIRMGSF